MFESMMLLFSIIIFIIMLVFSYILYNRIKYAIKEYNEAKILVGNIVSIFKKRIDRQNDNINNTIISIDEIQSSINNNSIINNHLQHKVNNIVNKVTSAFLIDKKIADSIIDINKKIRVMNKRIDDIKTVNDVLRNSIESFNKEKETIVQPLISLQSDLRSTFINLTRTEKQIIRILITEGAKTSPMIMDVIGLTREHTSRLMKKLWQEGYIERDTNSMPFIYRPTKELEKRINI